MKGKNALEVRRDVKFQGISPISLMNLSR